MKFAEHSDGR